MNQVLFVCSGNYYRSRFAEHLFNWLAPQVDLAWVAGSRGLSVGESANVGPISRLAEEGLRRRGIPMSGVHRYPIALKRSDLDASALVIAMKEAEHRRRMVEQFPDWSGTIEYWHIDDLDCAGPEVALPQLNDKVRGLVARLKHPAGTTSSHVA